MNKTKRTRIIATFFLIIIFPTILPINLLYASNNGPNAPEASGFESVNATDMVNLASGDMAYVLPLMDVGGFPVSLSYHGGVPLDLESTWTGLGWNLNTGAINRGLNSTPDDWKGGNSLDFIHYEDVETIISVNVGVGIGKAAEIGIGASMSSNKGLSGSVYASIGIAGVAQASGSIDTNGNYSLGIGAGTGKGDGGASFGGGISMSGNVSGGKDNFGANVGYRSASGLTVGMGASLDGGLSSSLGYSDTKGTGSNTKGVSGGASLSISSFSSGDWQVNSEGWYVPIQIGIFSFGFGEQKVTYTLKKAYKKLGYGILYSNNDAVENDNSTDTQFTDYQNRYRYADAYDQALPQTEVEFVGDYDADREKLNFTFAGYDSYDVNATGIAGVMSPRILQNATIYGMGYNGSDPNSANGKLKIYHHNSLTTDKTFGQNTPNDIEFYFNGQFSQNATTSSLIPSSNTSTTLQGILSARQALNNNRLKQGNYVEVFTNKQIKNGLAPGLLSPLNPTGNGVALDPLVRSSAEYKDEGIGGYKITSPDGKIYHFSQPVYHFEQVERNVLKDNTEDHVSEKRQYTSYATHWLLTAITGPDFIDTNNNNIADPADYGYWVRMEYGKWSDGYVWRSPTDKNLKDYNTNLKGNIGTKEFGTYQFGRKQLYYLDKVVSATHTAFFVKDLRYDSVGSDLNYAFNPFITLTNSGTGNPTTGDPGITPTENFTYQRQMQLMLEKIILVKNENAQISRGSASDALKLSYPSPSDNVKSYQPNFASNGGFYAENSGRPVVTVNNESGVYDVKDFENFNYGKAIKVVDLEYNYNLAVKDHNNNPTNPDINKSMGSPGTILGTVNPNGGKLCLKSVKFLGRNNFDYMPPYKFEYKGEYINSSLPYIKYPPNAIVQKTKLIFGGQYNFNGQFIANPVTTFIPIENIRAKDEWGYLKDTPGQENQVMAAAWTMNKIITPTGSSIDIENEEDDFGVEAFARRYWNENLKFKTRNLDSSVEIEIQNQDGLAAGLGVDDFRQYFRINERVYLDLWLARAQGGSTSISGTLDVNANSYCTVSEVSAGSVKIKASKRPIVLRVIPGSGGIVNIGGNELENQLPIPPVVISSVPATFSGFNYLVQNCFFSKSNSGCSNVYSTMPRGGIPEVGNCPFDINCPDHWTMTYKILANKTPENLQGGGLRVKSITLNDENNNQFKTSYYYNMPGTGKIKNTSNYASSGITSYSPVRGTKFVPYQSELPSPGVMYEYVTMVAENKSGGSLGETRYRFHVLKPVFDIFNENIVMSDDIGTEIFKATVTNHNSNGGYLNPAKKIQAKSINLGVNTSLIGQFRSIEEFNNQGHLLSKVEKQYLSGEPLKQKGIRGTITESFQSMKSVFTTDENYNNPVLKNRFLSISTKEEYTSVLKSTTSTGPHGVNIETYSDADPITGAFLTVEKKMSDGTNTKVTNVPAYVKYPEMGSKIDNINNKNMLSQTAVEYSCIYKNGWKETGVGITTWSNIWSYKDIAGVTTTPSLAKEKIWRKHKTFMWNGVKEVNGIFTNYNSATNDGFSWTVGVGTQQPAQWKQASEITLYDHYSAQLEMKDINGNLAATKMGDNDTKIMATGNAGYNEMYYAGGENLTGTWFEPEIPVGATTQNATYFHTGKKSVAATSSSQFGVLMKSGQHRPGKYKVSVWVEKTNAAKAVLRVNGTPINFATDNIVAGNWVLKTGIVSVPVGDCAVFLHSADANPVYFDDLMIRPLASSVTGYVYNEFDELTHIIGNNGLASRFEYDAAGRLVKTYVEVVDDPANGIVGGFKLKSENKINYKKL
jgi:YD repeat-containing protein